MAAMFKTLRTATALHRQLVCTKYTPLLGNLKCHDISNLTTRNLSTQYRGSGLTKGVFFCQAANKQNLCWQTLNSKMCFVQSSGSKIFLISENFYPSVIATRCFSKRQGDYLDDKENGGYIVYEDGRYRRKKHMDDGPKSMLYYFGALVVMMLGLSYAGVPLYKMFCQTTGYGGTIQVQGHDTSKVKDMEPVRYRKIKVKFNADTHAAMQWKFRPQQTEVTVVPGETALAFFSAENPTDKPVIGISTYNVLPFEVGPYFNKIQCFCFEEQLLNPHEKVDMPVFFYIDPDFDDDPKMEFIDEIMLSYTFFQAKEGLSLPLPGFMQQPAQATA